MKTIQIYLFTYFHKHDTNYLIGELDEPFLLFKELPMGSFLLII